MTVQLAEFDSYVLDMAVLAEVHMESGIGNFKKMLDQFCVQHDWYYQDLETGEIQFYKTKQ